MVWRIFFLGFLGLRLLGSCNSESDSLSDKKVFRYNEPGGISSLDPAYSRNLENIWAVNQIFDGLVYLDKDLRIQPSIAKSWEIDSSGTQYTFKLRSDVYFHSHQLFNSKEERVLRAKDVVYSLQRLVDPETASPGRWVLDDIKRNDGKLGVVEVNDTVLQITLNHPAPRFLSLLAMQYCAVVPQKIVEYYGKEFRSNPIGCGPFQFFIWEEGLKLILHKNPSYYMTSKAGEALPKLDAVAVSFIKDQSAALMAMQRKDFDFMSGLDAASKHRVLAADGSLTNEFETDFTLMKSPFLKTDYLGIRLGLDEDLANPIFRKALSMAINREDLVRYVLNGIGEPAAYGFVPKSMWDTVLVPHPSLTYQPKRARSIIDSLGLEGKEITISTTSTALEVCEYIQNTWQQVGINCKVEVLPNSQHREQAAQGNLTVFRKSWIADYPDPENFLGLGLGDNIVPNGPNYFFFQNSHFDAVFKNASAEFGSSRTSSLLQLNEILNRELPIIPLFYDANFQLVSNRVIGLKSNAMNVLDLLKVDLVPKALAN